MQRQLTLSPVDGRVLVERDYATAAQVERALTLAARAQAGWRRTDVETRARICRVFCDAFAASGAEIAPELSWQMGRPIAFAPSEVRGTLERARHMIDIAATTLADVAVAEKAGFTRFIRREPLGVVLTIAAWNYPYLIAINSVIPALMAGNAVLLKHSAQTPLCAERFAAAFAAAGLPSGLFQVLHLTHEQTAQLIGDSRIGYVAFTGSVQGGLAVQAAASARVLGLGLELGGNDPAYVRADADFDHAVENLVDGAFFNSGQSCCGVGRIYVAEKLFARFVEASVALTQRYVLGDPLDPATTLGPCVRTAAADAVRGVIGQAVTDGARTLIDETRFPASRAGTPYLAPQILVGVGQSMQVQREETFGPLVTI
ncbi:MAG: aldehyde dehydrogenase family protein, partial [Pseudomonadota bacterium]